MSVAFWSVKLTNNKPVEVQPPEGYVLNVQQAAIAGEGTAIVKVNTVSVEGDKLDAVICTLRSKTTDQVNLSLVFGYDVPVAFVSEGKGEVYLSGYYQPGPEEDDENDYDMDDEDDEDEEGSEDDDEDEEDDEDYGDEEANIKSAEAAIAKLGAANKQKKELVVSGKKLSGTATMEIDSEDDSEGDDEEDSEDEDDSEEERVDQAFIKKMIARNGLDSKAPKSSRVEELDKTEESGSDDEDDEEDSEDEESDEEEEPPVKVQKSTPKGFVTASGQNSKPQTPKPQTPGNNNNNNNNKPKTPQQGNKTPNGGNNNKTPNGNNNKTPQGNNIKNNNNSGFKSGDKRKR